MLRLRPYKPCDAESIVSWCESKKTFALWGGNRFGTFPISAETMNRKYLDENGDCAESDNFYPMTAADDNGAAGHFIIRYIDGDSKVLRLGWVILDPSRRGMGFGKEMIRLGIKFAFEIMGADRLTIGVIESNAPAYRCYLSAGFRRSEHLADSQIEIDGEKLKIIELELTKEEFFNKR